MTIVEYICVQRVFFTAELIAAEREPPSDAVQQLTSSALRRAVSRLAISSLLQSHYGRVSTLRERIPRSASHPV